MGIQSVAFPDSWDTPIFDEKSARNTSLSRIKVARKTIAFYSFCSRKLRLGWALPSSCTPEFSSRNHWSPSSKVSFSKVTGHLCQAAAEGQYGLVFKQMSILRL